MSSQAEIVLQQIAGLEARIASHREVIATVDEVLGPGESDASLEAEKDEALASIEALEAQIAALKRLPEEITTDAPTESKDSDDSTPKWDLTKHPKFRDASQDIPPPLPPPAEEAPQVFNVKDVVLAKWSSDRLFWEATIISKTGSSADPVYTVSFKADGAKETKRKHEVRAIPNKKRKADGPPAAVSTPPVSASPQPRTNGAVISAPPVVDTSLIQKREPSMVSDGPTRMKPEKKKLKGNKQLEGKQNNWQSFMKTGPKKTNVAATKPKDSMFRTPDAPSAKVGVIGSGKGITKDQSRAKWGGGAGSYNRDRED